MTAETDISRLLTEMNPVLEQGEFLFVSFKEARYGDYADLNPIASFAEREGLTLVVPRGKAEARGLSFEGAFRMITLGVHSSLEAVGLTAAVATRLAEAGIAANVVAAFFHDHLFVPTRHAAEALSLLKSLSDTPPAGQLRTP